MSSFCGQKLAIQTPAVSLPSAVRGCWLLQFCRAALRHFKEFPNSLSLERIKPRADESEHGSGRASTPSRPSVQPAASPALQMDKETEPCTKKVAARGPRAPQYQQALEPRCPSSRGRMLSPLPCTAADPEAGANIKPLSLSLPELSPAPTPAHPQFPRPSGGGQGTHLPARLSGPGSWGMRIWDAGGRVLRLICGLTLIHGLAALLDLVQLPHPQGFSHLLILTFLIFSPISNPMPNSSSSS